MVDQFFQNPEVQRQVNFGVGFPAGGVEIGDRRFGVIQMHLRFPLEKAIPSPLKAFGDFQRIRQINIFGTILQRLVGGFEDVEGLIRRRQGRQPILSGEGDFGQKSHDREPGAPGRR